MKCAIWIEERDCCAALGIYYLSLEFLERLLLIPDTEEILKETFEELLLKEQKDAENREKISNLEAGPKKG